MPPRHPPPPLQIEIDMLLYDEVQPREPQKGPDYFSGLDFGTPIWVTPPGSVDPEPLVIQDQSTPIPTFNSLDESEEYKSSDYDVAIIGKGKKAKKSKKGKQPPPRMVNLPNNQGVNGVIPDMWGVFPTEGTEVPICDNSMCGALTFCIYHSQKMSIVWTGYEAQSVSK
ncbi:hypothetical protein AN958_09082 [Leucoagaricus sp. SymC.cos]|nr:hypothetical protein AN958_09082 [Leucoagaricus sp. SymC.cos]